jgi:hypothetical protein
MPAIGYVKEKSFQTTKEGTRGFRSTLMRPSEKVLKKYVSAIC